MNRTIRRAGALLLSLVLAAPASAAEQFVNVLTGGTSGVYYPLGVALANDIGKAMPGVKTSVQATKASVENLNLLQAGRGEVAFTLGDSLSDAWKGNEEAGFKTPLKKLRGIAAIYPNYIQIVARADAGIKTIADLKGKRISVGAPKSGTELNARTIFAAAGLTYKDFAKVEYLPFGESVELMKNRQLDVTLQSAGLGVSALRDLATSVEIIVVAIPADIIKKTNDPAYLPAMIPANTYRGQTTDVPRRQSRTISSPTTGSATTPCTGSRRRSGRRSISSSRRIRPPRRSAQARARRDANSAPSRRREILQGSRTHQVAQDTSGICRWPRTGLRNSSIPASTSHSTRRASSASSRASPGKSSRASPSPFPHTSCSSRRSARCRASSRARSTSASCWSWRS